MLEQADQRELVKRVGGVFRLCSMIQKRMRELVMGARPLVEVELTERRDLLGIILREIEEGKVSIAEEGETSVDLPFGEAGELTDSIDLDELRSVVSDEDLNILLPGDDDEKDDDDTAGLTVVADPVTEVSNDENGEEDAAPGKTTDETTDGDADEDDDDDSDDADEDDDTDEDDDEDKTD